MFAYIFPMSDGCIQVVVFWSQTTIGLMMGQRLVLFLSCLPITVLVRLHDRCESYNLTNLFHGRYCPTGGGTTTKGLAWHQCKLFCLHTPSCQAVNYNFTANLCTHFTATCPLAIRAPSMAFWLFTRKQPHECLEWIPKPDRGFSGDRSVTYDNLRFVARMQKDGNDFGAYFYPKNYRCFSRDDDAWIRNFDGGYPCQYLRIRDGCTVYSVHYKMGTPVPPNAVMSGYTATGLPIYIARRTINERTLGYYIAGSNKLYDFIGFHFGNAMLLVVL